MHTEENDVSRLTRTLEELERANAEAQAAREAAEQARAQAEKAARARSEFLASMSHEIRTPINAILGFDEMILRESVEQETRQYALDIRSAGRTLLGIINDILDFSRAESGHMEIIPREYRLHTLIGDVCNMITLKAKGKGIYFEQMIDPMIPDVLYGDEKRIKQILVNILTNAVKYTDIGGAQLRVGFTRKSDDEIDLSVSVQDTGRGMRPEDLRRLFSPYERIDEADNTEVEGTGLGMTITKQLLEMMDSQLVVESVFGEGSTFSFSITQKVIDEEPFGDFEERMRLSEEEEYIAHKSFIAPDAHILVVDDTPINIRVFSALLKHTRINIDSAGSGGDAFKLACKRRYDMLFLDHMMPDMDGIETLEVIRSYDASLNVDTPAVMLTANAMSGAREEYMNKGFTDYLSKPIDPVKLESLLRKYLPEDYCLDSDDVQTGQDTAGKAFHDDEKREGSEAGCIDDVCSSGAEYEGGACGSGEAGDGDGGETGTGDARYAGGAYGSDEAGDGIGESGAGDAAELVDGVCGISVMSGIEASGGREIYDDVVRDFAATGEERASRIREYFEVRDYDAYTIQVHALKSTARLAGAMTLSARAMKLEECGRERNEEVIAAETPGLIEDYLELVYELKGRLESNTDRPLIDDEQLKEAVDAIVEAMTVFDLDMADSIMKQLEGYSMPESFKDKYARLRVLMAEVERDGILELLKGDYSGND